MIPICGDQKSVMYKLLKPSEVINGEALSIANQQIDAIDC